MTRAVTRGTTCTDARCVCPLDPSRGGNTRHWDEDVVHVVADSIRYAIQEDECVQAHIADAEVRAAASPGHAKLDRARVVAALFISEGLASWSAPRRQEWRAQEWRAACERELRGYLAR